MSTECKCMASQIETHICICRTTTRQFMWQQQQHTCGALGGSPMECGVGGRIERNGSNEQVRQITVFLLRNLCPCRRSQITTVHRGCWTQTRACAVTAPLFFGAACILWTSSNGWSPTASMGFSWSGHHPGPLQDLVIILGPCNYRARIRCTFLPPISWALIVHM